MRKIQCPFLTIPVAAALLWAAFPAWADNDIYAQDTERGVQLADETMPDGRTAVHAVFRVDADPDTVYRTLCDVTHFPEFMPNTSAVSVLTAAAGFQVVRFSVPEACQPRGLRAGVMRQLRSLDAGARAGEALCDR
jgi:hypothetical protein